MYIHMDPLGLSQRMIAAIQSLSSLFGAVDHQALGIQCGHGTSPNSIGFHWFIIMSHWIKMATWVFLSISGVIVVEVWRLHAALVDDRSHQASWEHGCDMNGSKTLKLPVFYTPRNPKCCKNHVRKIGMHIQFPSGKLSCPLKLPGRLLSCAVALKFDGVIVNRECGPAEGGNRGSVCCMLVPYVEMAWTFSRHEIGSPFQSWGCSTTLPHHEWDPIEVINPKH